MPIITHDSASQRVSVRATGRDYGGRPLAIVYDIDNRGERTDTGYIVALTESVVPIDDEDREIVFRDAVLDDLRRGEWLANWGGPSDAYDDPGEWIAHHADLGEPREIVERFAELMRRHWPTSQDVETDIARTIVRAVAMPGDHDAGQNRIERIGDAVRWIAASLPMLDAAVLPDGRAQLFDRSLGPCHSRHAAQLQELDQCTRQSS